MASEHGVPGMDEPPEDLVSVGGEIDLVKISLRVVGEDLDPDEVTELLGVEPTFAARKGEMVEVLGGLRTQPTGLWVLDLGDSPEWELADGISTLLDRMPDDPELWEDLAGRYKLDLFCGAFLQAANRGFALPEELIRRMADRRLAFSVDIYCSVPDEPDY